MAIGFEVDVALIIPPSDLSGRQNVAIDSHIGRFGMMIVGGFGTEEEGR